MPPDSSKFNDPLDEILKEASKEATLERENIAKSREDEENARRQQEQDAMARKRAEILAEREDAVRRRQDQILGKAGGAYPVAKPTERVIPAELSADKKGRSRTTQILAMTGGIIVLGVAIALGFPKLIGSGDEPAATQSDPNTSPTKPKTTTPTAAATDASSADASSASKDVTTAASDAGSITVKDSATGDAKATADNPKTTAAVETKLKTTSKKRKKRKKRRKTRKKKLKIPTSFKGMK